jgi:hypothetical protein
MCHVTWLSSRCGVSRGAAFPRDVACHVPRRRCHVTCITWCGCHVICSRDVGCHVMWRSRDVCRVAWCGLPHDVSCDTCHVARCHVTNQAMPCDATVTCCDVVCRVVYHVTYVRHVMCNVTWCHVSRDVACNMMRGRDACLLWHVVWRGRDACPPNGVTRCVMWCAACCDVPLGVVYHAVLWVTWCGVPQDIPRGIDVWSDEACYMMWGAMMYRVLWCVTRCIMCHVTMWRVTPCDVPRAVVYHVMWYATLYASRDPETRFVVSCVAWRVTWCYVAVTVTWCSDSPRRAICRVAWYCVTCCHRHDVLCDITLRHVSRPDHASWYIASHGTPRDVSRHVTWHPTRYIHGESRGAPLYVAHISATPHHVIRYVTRITVSRDEPHRVTRNITNTPLHVTPSHKALRGTYHETLCDVMWHVTWRDITSHHTTRHTAWLDPSHDTSRETASRDITMTRDASREAPLETWHHVTRHPTSHDTPDRAAHHMRTWHPALRHVTKEDHAATLRVTLHILRHITSRGTSHGAARVACCATWCAPHDMYRMMRNSTRHAMCGRDGCHETCGRYARHVTC